LSQGIPKCFALPDGDGDARARPASFEASPPRKTAVSEQMSEGGSQVKEGASPSKLHSEVREIDGGLLLPFLLVLAEFRRLLGETQ